MAMQAKRKKNGSMKGKLILVLIVAIVLTISIVVSLIIIRKKIYQANLAPDPIVGKYYLLVDNERSNTVYYDLKTGNVFEFVDGDKTTNGKFMTTKDGDVVKITFDFGDKKTDGTIKSGALTIGNDAYYKTDATLPVTSEKFFEYGTDGNKTGNYLVLNSDGTYEYVKDGVLYTGTYDVKENGDVKNVTFKGEGGLTNGTLADGKLNIGDISFVEEKKPSGGEIEPEKPVTSEKFFECDADGNKTDNYLELKSDGTYEYVKDGKTFTGTYEKTENGDTVNVTFNGEGGLTNGTLTDGKLNVGDISFVEDGKQEPIYDVDNLKYSVVDYNGHSVISIEGVKDFTSTTVNIPESITHEGKSYPVVMIGKEAFSDCPFLETVTMPDSVLAVGEGAFKECRNLKNVVLSNNLEKIDQYTFENCKSLTKIVITRNVETICSYAFKGCSRLETVEYVDDPLLNTIEQDAFQDCVALKDITIPTKTIYLSGFRGCSSLRTVTSNAQKLQTIGSHAFDGCKALDSVDILNTVSNIDEYAFSNCKSITDISLGDNINKIPQYAFANCESLTNIAIPKNVKTVCSYAFQDCGKLKTVTFRDSKKSLLNTIEEDAFQNCKVLTSIVIPDSVTYLSGFRGCSALTGVTVSEISNLQTIGEYAFYDCNLSNKFKITSNVKQIDDYAFGHNKNLVTLDYLSGCTEQWRNIVKSQHWKTDSSIKLFFCTNGYQHDIDTLKIVKISL